MTDISKALALVAVGSACGGMARFWISGLVTRGLGATFPWGTLTVNVSGAFLIGLMGSMASMRQGIFADVDPMLFAITGFLGCYTTASSFSLQTLMLVRSGEAWSAAGNVAASLGLCIVAVALGIAASRLWWS